MKRLFFLFTLCGLTLNAMAVPAKPVTQIVRQSDGTELFIQLRGDETFHYYVTLDGKPVCKNAKGDWVPDTREVVELHRAASARRNNNRMQLHEHIQKAMRAVHAPYRIGEMKTKRGLLILVNFQDQQMVNGDQSHEIFDQMLNAIGNPYGDNYGSVREYFLAQSYGEFDIEFDIVGPVTLSHNMKYYGEDTDSQGYDMRPGEMIAEACQLADELVNFAAYDWDGDGEVENIYVTYAGYAQSSGASSYTVWPHQWWLSDKSNYGQSITLDGVIIDTYACGSELSDTKGTKIEGVGTMCHEYSHCLGLPDFYDTNGVATGMSYWSVMDAGCYNGDGYCPAGYTSYERWFAGWLTPVELKRETVVEGMKNIEENPEAYIIYNDNNRNEYYMLANHQLVGWDKEMLGHGMMVLHVDYDKKIWIDNEVNNKKTHQRMTIIPADGIFNSSLYYTELKKMLIGDLWPGTANNTALTDDTTPAATLYNKNTDGNNLMHKPITDITETNGLIGFVFMKGIEDAISNVQTDGISTQRVFDLMGRSGDVSHQRGIYLIDGQKFLVK